MRITGRGCENGHGANKLSGQAERCSDSRQIGQDATAGKPPQPAYRTTYPPTQNFGVASFLSLACGHTEGFGVLPRRPSRLLSTSHARGGGGKGKRPCTQSPSPEFCRQFRNYHVPMLENRRNPGQKEREHPRPPRHASRVYGPVIHEKRKGIRWSEFRCISLQIPLSFFPGKCRDQYVTADANIGLLKDRHNPVRISRVVTPGAFKLQQAWRPWLPGKYVCPPALMSERKKQQRGLPRLRVSRK